MMLFSLIAVSAITHFGGGTANDLAKSIAEATGQNVMIFQANPAKIEPFDYDTTKLDDFARTMRTKANLLLAPGTDYIFSDGVIPSSKMPPRYVMRGGQPMGGGPLPDGALKDGLVTIKTEGNNGIAVAALANTTWSKKLDVDPYFAGVAFAAQIKDMKEDTFLRWVGKATGGMLNPINGYHFKVDGTETKARLLRTIDKQLDLLVKGVSRERDDLLLAAAQQASAQQIAELAGAPNKEIMLQLQNGTALGKAAMARLAALDKRPKEGQVRQNDTVAAPPSIISRIDPRQPSYAVIGQNFEVFVDVPLGGRGNNRTRF